MSRLVTTIVKNRREELRVTLDEFKGAQLVNLRVWFRAEDGEMRPGNAGLSMRVDKLSEMAAALSMAEAEARAMGVL